MSKLNSITLFTITLLPLVVGLIFSAVSKKTMAKEPPTATALFSKDTQLWGKAQGPVQVRIDFKEQSGDRVTLEGHIRSSLENFEIEWKLPAGVKLVEGQLQEKIQQSAEWQEHVRTLVVEVKWPLEKPHLVLRAAENQNANARGASTVFNLDPSLWEMEKEEIIRSHMKSRNIKKILK